MSEQGYFAAAEDQLPNNDPVLEPELTPEQEKEFDDLVDQGVYNPQTARAIVLGLPLSESLGETSVRTVTATGGTTTSPVRRSAGPSPRRKMSARKRAWGDQAAAEDGTYHPLN